MIAKDCNKDLVSMDTKVRKSVPGSELSEKSVDGNGYAVGQTFHLIGTVTPKVITIGEKDVVMDLVDNTEGARISLRSLMGVLSLTGQKQNATFVSQKFSEDGTLVDIPVEATANGVKEGDYFRSNERNYKAFVEAVAAGKYDFRDKKLTYLGTVVHDYVASQPSPATSIDSYPTGAKRAIATRLWDLDAMPVADETPENSAN